MTENTFFDNWAGRSVDFATAGTPSKWILTELLSEKNSQVHGDDFFKNGCIGGAYGTFLCHNVTDSTQRGVMKVLMQYVPLGLKKFQITYRPLEFLGRDPNMRRLSTGLAKPLPLMSWTGI